MNYTQKKYTLLFLIVLSALITIHFLANYFLVKQIDHFVSDKDIEIYYDDVSVNLLTASISFVKLNLNTKITTSTKNSLQLSIPQLDISGLNYYQLLFKKAIVLNSIQLTSPDLKFFKYINTKSITKNNSTRPITINSFVINGGSFELYKSKKNIPDLSIQNMDTKINELGLFHQTADFPVTYTNIESKLRGITTKVGNWEKLFIDTVTINPKAIYLSNLKLETIFSKKTLSSHLKKERDHVSLVIPKIHFSRWFLKKIESKNTFGAESIIVKNADLNLYRDKSVPDNTKYKSLYSEKIRNLDFGIDFPKISIENASINYEQRLEGNEKPGKLYFEDVNAVTSLSNTENKNYQIKLEAEGTFMGNADIALNTKFKSLTSDEFMAKGSIKNFDGNSLNTYLEKNLKTRIKGRADEIYFTITGNNKRAAGDIKMKYTDFKIEILKQHSLKVNKFLSAVGNLLLKEKEDTTAYHYGKIDTERDQTKSFFNFLWISLRDGLKDIITNKKTSKK